VACLGGQIELAGLELGAALNPDGAPAKAHVAGKAISAQSKIDGQRLLVTLERPVTLRPGERLVVNFGE
jgi:hypothetical protein